MPCHPPFPLMVFWSLKLLRSRQEEKVFTLDPIFFIYLLNVQINRSASLAGSSRSPSQISHLCANRLQLVLKLLLETCMMITTNSMLPYKDKL